MANPYLSRNQKNDGRQAEKRTAKSLNARTQPGSGAKEGAKGDIKTVAALIEQKSTEGKSLSLNHEWLNKINGEALHTNRNPVLIVSFVYPDGRSKTNGDWIVIPRWLAEEKDVL